MVGLYIIELKYTLCVFLSDDSLCFIPGNTNFAPQFAAALLIIFHSTIDKSISRGVLEKAILKHFAKFKKKKDLVACLSTNISVLNMSKQVIRGGKQK